MRFDRVHTVVTYLLVSTGFLMLFLSGELPVLFWLWVVPLSIGSGIGRVARLLSSVLFWNVVLVLGLFVLGAMGYISGDWLLYAIYFCSLMVVAKLYQRHTAQDDFQLYAVSFMQLIVAAVINPTISFGFCFILYVVFLTWALVLLHLRREMEQLAERSADDPGLAEEARTARARQLVGPGFLVGSSVLALAIFACSIVVFLFFPRLGLGLFGQHQRKGPAVSGFSDSIELGGFGRLKLDQTTILRVELNDSSVAESESDPAAIQRVLPLRLKGISFDFYDGRGWSKSQLLMHPLEYTRNDFWIARDTDPVPENALLLSLRVYMEQMQIDRKAIFAEGRVRGVRDLTNSRFVPLTKLRTRFYQDAELDLLFAKRSSAPLRYAVDSYRVVRDPQLLRATGTQYPSRVARYLQLPALDSRIVELAKRITANAPTPFDKLGALERHLLANYDYSLAGGHDLEDPLADFLFGLKEGHCEYFSTALTIMSRVVGVPTRTVGGFFGGEYNDVGQYVQVRQADAHSWVEAYFPGVGWVPFDATPADGALVGANDSMFGGLKQFFDAMELAWHKWVIRWDLERQFDFLSGIGQTLGKLNNLFSDRKEKQRSRSFRGALKVLREWVVFGIVGFVLILLIVNRRRLRRMIFRRAPEGVQVALPGNRTRSSRRIQKLYGLLVRLAGRRGIPIRPGTTPQLLVEHIAERSPEAAIHAALLVALYEETIFGGQPLDPVDGRQAHRAYRAIRSESRRWSKAA